MSKLFEPLLMGDLWLPNRIIMAPLTRLRAAPGRVPRDLNAEYYAQRASAGFILSEATAVTPQGVGYPNSPGLWTVDQVEGWKIVTKAVHAAGGRIFAQLWHVGRISHSSYLDGASPVAPSAIAAEGNVSIIRPPTPFEVPRALETNEMPGVIEAYRLGAANAKAAGFDGVEIHGANGYLPDQFLQDSTNKRTDAWGGSIENRARLLLEATDAAISVFGPQRVGVHISPRGASHSLSDSDPFATFGYVARQLRIRNIAFLFVRETAREDRMLPVLKDTFGGVTIANDGLTPETAEQLLDSGAADAVSFGRPFIANPDLPLRIARGLPLAPVNASTIYTADGTGYTDYPAAAWA